jgi:hypothetical protein
VRLNNFSVRARVGTGDAILIPGYAVSGSPSGTKRLLIRAIGPGLSPFGVSGVLAHPELTVHAGANIVATNAGWGTAANPTALATAASAVGAFALTPGSADSAVIVDLAPGPYTVVVRGADGSSGIALAEIYEISDDARQIVNLSARVQTGGEGGTPMAGFNVGGSVPAKVLIRVAGPALSAYGVAGTLARPELTVFSGGNMVATNAGWGTSSDPAAIAAAAAAGGAFPLPSGSADAALLLTLAPGSYTASVGGVGNASGITLLEVYQVP